MLRIELAILIKFWVLGFELAIVICIKDLCNIRDNALMGPILLESGSSFLSSITVNLDGELHPDGQNGLI